MKTLFIIGKNWPEPATTGAGLRMIQLIELFKAYNFSIHFGCTAQKGDLSQNLDDFDITSHQLELNNSSFDDLITSLKPEIVLFDRFITEEQFGWRVSEHCDSALKILDTEDLHCLRAGRQNAFKNNRNFKKEDLFNNIAKRELASILRCDLSLIISEEEINILKRVFHIDSSKLYYLPFLYNYLSKEYKSSLPLFEERSDFVSIGNFHHAPNITSVLQVANEIWPLIRKQLPKANIKIYGAYAKDNILKLHAPKRGIHVMGHVKNADDVLMNARLLIAPLQFGAGLKTKFIEAMKNGTPSVTTTIGAEGLCGALPFGGEIANTTQDIAKEAIKHYTSKNQWLTAQRNGFNLINKRFQKSSFESNFSDKLNHLTKRIKQHRQDNFIGEILQHHTLQSTKYLSKWIEAKNN